MVVDGAKLNGIPEAAYNEIVGALITEATGNNLSLRGFAHTCQRVISLTTGVTNIWFDPTAIVTPLVPVLGPFFKTDSADVVATLYFGSTYTGGSVVTCFNRLEGGKPCGGKIIEAATVDAVGVEAAQYLLSSGFLSGGSQTSDALPFGKLNTSPVRVELNAAGATEFEYRLTWFEL